MEAQKKQALIKGAVITGVINAVINGGIQYFLLKGNDVIPISVDAITNTEETVLGTAVMLSITLAMILTVIGYFTLKEEKVKFFPTALWITIKHGFFTFGILTSLAVLWQKNMGTVEVSLMSAIVIIGVISGIVSGVIQYLTITSCVKDKNQIDEK